MIIDKFNKEVPVSWCELRMPPDSQEKSVGPATGFADQPEVHITYECKYLNGKFCNSLVLANEAWLNGVE